jgi:ubiquinone/menaquinone biosynthesis C-methylase UbiE
MRSIACESSASDVTMRPDMEPVLASDLEYHLAEFAIARMDGDKRRILPEIPLGCERLLDVGCGAGQTLECCKKKGVGAFGIDYDLEALQLGRKLNVSAELACSRGEVLPFREQSFDFIISRVSLPYMNIPVALEDLARVLKPSGRLWLVLHSLCRLNWCDALTSPRRAAYEVYRLLNTAALHFGGFQFRYPLRRSRIESYQTVSGMRRALTRTGFENIQVELGTHFVITARKSVLPRAK